MFTARNRQSPFAARAARQREAEAAAAESEPAPEPEPAAVAYDTNESPTYTTAPDISTYASGGIVEPPKAVDPEEFPPSEEQTARGNVVLDVPPISAETQAKIDAVVNKAVPPAADEQAPAAEPVADEPKRGRGRPRPQETIDRDNAVHALLAAADENGVSKEALALSLDEKEQQVYSSLRQLSKEGRAETRYIKGHGYRWFAV